MGPNGPAPRRACAPRWSRGRKAVRAVVDVLETPWEGAAPGGRLTELTAQDGLALLAAGTVGRVVYCDDHGPLAVPVNYVVQDRTILFRTAHGSLGEHLRESAVCAVEIDQIDTRLASGWSVLARGSAALVRHPSGVRDLRWPLPWVGGVRPLLIRITPSELTGRRIDVELPARG